MRGSSCCAHCPHLPPAPSPLSPRPPGQKGRLMEMKCHECLLFCFIVKGNTTCFINISHAMQVNAMHVLKCLKCAMPCPKAQHMHAKMHACKNEMGRGWKGTLQHKLTCKMPSPACHMCTRMPSHAFVHPCNGTQTQNGIVG